MKEKLSVAFKKLNKVAKALSIMSKAGLDILAAIKG